MSASNATPPVEDEHRRKRVRKGTKSCWECKRRKIKCQLSTENVPVCSGCLQRGTNCVSQEYPEEYDQPSGAQLGERLGRVEMLLEKLLEKVNQYESEKGALPTPESTANDVLTPYSGSGPTGFDSAPIMSLFDNVVIGRRDTAKVHSPQQPLPTPPTVAQNISTCRPPSKLERIRMTIVAQLPCQQDSDLICHASNCWLLIHALSRTSTSELFTNHNTVTSFHLAEVARQHPTLVTRTLLYIAVCMQQLPNTFDVKSLQITNINETMDKYLSTASLVTSDDELVSTLEGLECLVLQGIFHINAGNLRRAWLTFRRALNVGQLMGLHKGYTQTLFGKQPEKNLSGKRLWYQIIQADRYLALLLGMPCGSADDEIGPEETFQNPNVDVDQLFNRKMCSISGRIIERNQDDNAHAFAKTQSIDESLENLAKELPPSFWAVPKVLINDHSIHSAQQFDRIMAQILFFQLQSLLHLPYMLRASTERRYEYSRFACLSASRKMLTRYLALRSSMEQSFCCKVVDFGAFTATITIMLALLEPSQTPKSPAELEQCCEDKALVDTIVQSMEDLSCTGDVVATQSVDVIKTMCAICDTSGGSSGASNLRLTIPYFGTVNIVRAPRTSATRNEQAPISISRQPPTPGQNVGPQDWQALPFAPTITQPIVSFQSSQFPLFVSDPPIEDWNLQESDTLFFDSLLNTDIEGNWVF
ncbi:hypothetical protein BP6252_03092 [Coleophoma cylindrospora]|uniref:Zn(2)-C6 fungal-type domain-containing protein n=1 Tax=Coleophoma cylindrospora TaxID=1849047 RepID=A0A3D8S712_9HELO|nr:hypothetical protein BP6252_03092 [Coleophoma cylindrospora]